MIDLYVLTKNRCKCKQCGDIIESVHRHDFVSCLCGSIFTDGGLEYVRRGASELNLIEDMSEYRDKTLEELESSLVYMVESNKKYGLYVEEIKLFEDAISLIKKDTTDV